MPNLVKKVNSRKADQMATHITSQLSGIPSGFIKTLTFDNDPEASGPNTKKLPGNCGPIPTLQDLTHPKIRGRSRIASGLSDGSFRKVPTCVRSPASASKPSSDTSTFGLYENLTILIPFNNH
jgi:hypothetical protein